MCVYVCMCVCVRACVSAVRLCRTARDVAIRIKEELVYREDASRDRGSHAPGGSSLPMICKVMYIDTMKFMYQQSWILQLPVAKKSTSSFDSVLRAACSPCDAG
jgi:hypothetical protein